MSQIPISLIVAVARNGVIGANGRLPWHSAADLAHFKRTTRAAAVVMGRKTWESLPRRPLPERKNIVVSRARDFDAQGGEVCADPDAALAVARRWSRENGAREVFVIGGASLFAWALPHATRMYVSQMECEPEGDVFFSDWDEKVWRVTDTRRIAPERGNEPSVTVRILARRP